MFKLNKVRRNYDGPSDISRTIFYLSINTLNTYYRVLSQYSIRTFAKSYRKIVILC